ncbi:MAG: hypothetical protein EOO68_06410 [Moraxellaceae bacterium]|nr:MAG: hypothetical protein EOO68_06410 [Moraxellaceae bacterium]
MKFILLLIAALFVSGCKNGGSNANQQAQSGGFNYTAPTTEDLAQVQKTWAARDLSARDVRVVDEEITEQYTVTIYEHSIGNNKHYGAVAVPTDTAKAIYPVVVSPDGLDQSNPSITLENNLRYYNAKYVMVVPAFRGRALRYQDVSYFAGGDFCDAWDGATDDAMALLNLVQARVAQADMQRVLVSGYSRGATVALLMAARDERIKAVIAGSGPVDFYRQEVANRYGSQYHCQFIAGKTAAQSRQRMLASSPLYFNTLPSVEKIHLFQGGADTIVPAWNAEVMYAFLSAQKLDVELHLYPSLRHDNVFSGEDFLTTWNAAHDWFID